MDFRLLLGVLCFIICCFGIPSVALDCSSVTQKETCDECIKCGGIWCKNAQESLKCVSLTGGGDDWCPDPDDREIVFVDPNTRDGTIFRPQYEDMVAEINSGKFTQLFLNGTVEDIKSTQLRVTTTQSDKSKVHVKIDKLDTKIEVTTKIQDGFCSSTSQTIEHVFVEASVRVGGVYEKAVLKYHLPCACACSVKVEPQAPACHGFGNLICGSCVCNHDRRGKHCECGKAASSCVSSSSIKCSGNGHCDKCNTCQCNELVNIAGTERFDPQDNCNDIITSTVKDFFSCLNNSEAPCGACNHDIVFQKWNGTLAERRDGDRKLWVDLTAATGQPYWATRENGKIHIMRKPQSQC